MKTIQLITLTLMLGFALITHAVTVPYVDRVQPKTETEEVTETPQPADLKPNWWRYFEVTGDKLDRRINETLQQLEATVHDLPRDTADAARPLLDRLRANLNALPQAKVRTDPEPPPPLTAAASYTLAQLLDIARRLRTIQSALNSERDEAAAAVKGIEAAMQRIDTLMAAYLNLKPTNPVRILRGLEIMANRAAVAVAEERLRVHRAELAAHDKLAEQLMEEQAVATERLVVKLSDLTRLDTQLAQAQVILDQAQDALTRERASALTVQKDDPEGQASAHYYQQRVIHAEVADIDRGTLRDKLADWQAQLVNFQSQTKAWTRDSNRERDRASELVASAAGDLDLVRSLEMIAVKVLNQDRLDLAQETLITLERLEAAMTQANTVLQIVDQHLASREGKLGEWLARGELLFRHLWFEVSERMTTSLFKLGDTPVTALGLIWVAVILFIAWWISYGLRRALGRLGETHEGINQAALYTVARLSHYAIITVGFMVGLSSIGLDFTNFALVAGAIGIGIGFGLQSIVSNFVSGLILLFERNMKVGDFIELDSGVAGEVREINVRSTLINTNDNVDVVVPNSEFMNTKVTNWTLLEEYRRIHIAFKVAYDSDPDLVEKVALEAAQTVPHTLQGRNASVWLVNFGDSGLEYELVVWVAPQAVKRPGATAAAYKRAIAMALRRHGIEIPLPQRDLRLRNGFEGLQGNPRPGANLPMQDPPTEGSSPVAGTAASP